MRKHDLTARDIAERLTQHAEAVCREILPGGNRCCGEWVFDPGVGKIKVQLIGAKAGVWAHIGGNAGGDLLDLVKHVRRMSTIQAMGWAVEWLGLPTEQRATTRRVTSRRKATGKNNEGHRAYGLRLWREAKPAGNTLVGSYHRHRAITLPVPPSIRYHNDVKQRTGLSFQAQVAGVQRPDRSVIAAHLTFLRPDGRGKANVERSKVIYGALEDGAVRLAKVGPALGIAEGIETGLSAMQMFDIPIWCSLSCSRLNKLWLPPEVCEVHIFADNGVPGRTGAERAVEAYRDQGRRVVLRFPPEPFGDWNDALQALCKELG